MGDSGDPVCRSDLDSDAAYPIDYFAWANGYTEEAFIVTRITRLRLEMASVSR